MSSHEQHELLRHPVTTLAYPGDREELNQIEIIEVHGSAQLNIVRELFLEYQAALGVDLCFQDFATELEILPGKYAPPDGRLLLAQTNGAVIGCVALRPLTPLFVDTCETKRLYIRSSHRAAGAGRLLVERIITEARAIGYRHVRLDTLPSMSTAQRLYERLGFRDIAAYKPNSIFTFARQMTRNRNAAKCCR